MLRLTQLTNYGIALLGQMACKTGDCPTNTRDLAIALGLPVSTTSKILKSLSKSGLLVSHRGINGGYELARDPGQISMADVVAALEGRTLSSSAGTKAQAGEFIHKTIYRALANITLYEMAEQFAADMPDENEEKGQ